MLQQESGAFIQTQRDTEATPGSMEREVYITGTPDQIEMAKVRRRPWLQYTSLPCSGMSESSVLNHPAAGGDRCRGRPGRQPAGRQGQGQGGSAAGG